MKNQTHGVYEFTGLDYWTGLLDSLKNVVLHYFERSRLFQRSSGSWCFLARQPMGLVVKIIT